MIDPLSPQQTHGSHDPLTPGFRRKCPRIAARPDPSMWAPDELLTEIQVRKSGASGFAYEKFNRRAQDWAIVGAVDA